MATVGVRYLLAPRFAWSVAPIDDVDAALAFYTGHLGFEWAHAPRGAGSGKVMHPAPAFAMVSRGDLRSEVVTGMGGDQVIVDDPSGNPVELFQPTTDQARLSDGR